MRCVPTLTALAMLLAAPLSFAADEVPQVLTTQGLIQKVEKETITIKHRAADGKFDKDLTLTLTGTSRLSVLSTQKRNEKVVLVQKDVDGKHPAEKQTISVVYAKNGDENVLLA